MASLTDPIDVIAGHYTIDHSIVPSIRNIQTEFSAHNLKPYVSCNVYFDDTFVNPFIQPASVLATNIGTSSNNFHAGDGLYCNTTHAFVQVIDTSQANLIYVNENFITVNVTPFGPANSNTFFSDWYKSGDIVYQAKNSQNSEANTVLGTVAFWNYKDSALVVEVNNGLFSNTANNVILYKLGTAIAANGGIANVVNIVQGNRFPLTAQVTATNNVNNKFLVGNYVSNHGVIATSQNSAASSLNLSSNLNSTAVNSTIYIVSGDGIGQSAKIISVAGAVATLNTVLSFPLYTASGKQLAAGYAIGSPVVDDVGRVAGIFNIPEDQNLNFATGNRLFTINDGVSSTDPDASMRGQAIFAAVGSIAPTSTSSRTPVVSQSPTLTAAANGVTVQQASVSAGSVSNGPGSNNPQASPDPLAQTFTVPTPNTNKQSYGIYCTSIDLFFQNKPSGNSTQFPVTVRLAEVDNGIPTSTILATATVDWADVKVTGGFNAQSNTGVYPDSSNTQTITKFSFGDPIYLAPATEYAIVIYSESPDYDVWVANTGEAMVNSTRLVSQASFVGQFFEAQNASAWNPIPGQQLMFVLNKAQFSTTPVSLVFEAESPTTNTYMDLAVLHSSDLTFPVANINYSMLTTIANTGQPDTGYFEIDPNSTYNFGADLKNSSLDSNRRRVVWAGNGASTLVQATLFTTDPDVSPIFNSERLSLLAVTNLINDGYINNNDIAITNGGIHSNAANIVVTIGAPTGDNGIQATANVKSLVNSAVVQINITNPGTGYVIAPTISIREAGATANATAVVSGENGVSGGNGDTRYLTKTITLADGFDAGDLQVFVDCIRPQGTDVQAYYKVMSGQDSDNFDNKTWQQMQKAADVFSADQATQVSLTYNTGGSGALSYVQNGVTYPLGGKFKYFAIKLVLFANDPTVPPLVQDYRAVAIPAG
jgi:hypothetical protein